MLDKHYTDPRLVQLYDADSGWSRDRDYYLALATVAPQRILDLGCGTGLLCHAYARQGHRVTGADPSLQMLAQAQSKPGASEIEWIQASAQQIQLQQDFDLIIMTGHAFQVLPTAADLLSTFGKVKKHLAPGGQFVFESRNPDFDWSQSWDYEVLLELGSVSVKESRHLLHFDRKQMTFELRYQFPDETLHSMSQLQFWYREQIEARLLDCGLERVSCLGDWQGNLFDPEGSEEMIFHVRHQTEQRLNNK